MLTHVPPLDPLGERNGGFRSRSEAAKFLAEASDGGVDLLIVGHLHYEDFLEQAEIPLMINDADGRYGIVEVNKETSDIITSTVFIR